MGATESEALKRKKNRDKRETRAKEIHWKVLEVEWMKKRSKHSVTTPKNTNDRMSVMYQMMTTMTMTMTKKMRPRFIWKYYKNKL